MAASQRDVEAGQAVYTPRTLAIYDLVVLGVSNRLVWKCPTPRLLQHYDDYVSNNHLDVGVGSGYFLDHCKFPTTNPRVVLMDLNASALTYTARRIARFDPETRRFNVLEPIEWTGERFDSIGVNYLLHCLPGSIDQKAVIFDNLAKLMNPGAVLFGSTLLQGGVERGRTARRLMNFYNRRGIFSNERDDLEGLESALEQHLRDVIVEPVGCAALFAGRF
ncbi:MAG: class I SAM-dependent methyltransferase [Pirellulales bacterium]|nr:class I SAM-dependent methyltransferase [Pirellulales bacterium]